MNKLKLAGLIVSGLFGAFWLYFNIGSAIAEDATGDKIYHFIMALLMIIPFILAWKWTKVAGWYSVGLAILIGGGYLYLTYRGGAWGRTNISPWSLVLTFVLIGLLPLIAGLLFLQSDKKTQRTTT
ncbi:MAG: hypothetical protein ABIB97_01580 [Patescibacteria group bacterium]